MSQLSSGDRSLTSTASQSRSPSTKEMCGLRKRQYRSSWTECISGWTGGISIFFSKATTYHSSKNFRKTVRMGPPSKLKGFIEAWEMLNEQAIKDSFQTQFLVDAADPKSPSSYEVPFAFSRLFHDRLLPLIVRARAIKAAKGEGLHREELWRWISVMSAEEEVLTSPGASYDVDLHRALRLVFSGDILADSATEADRNCLIEVEHLLRQANLNAEKHILPSDEHLLKDGCRFVNRAFDIACEIHNRLEREDTKQTYSRLSRSIDPAEFTLTTDADRISIPSSTTATEWSEAVRLSSSLTRVPETHRPTRPGAFIVQ